MMIHSHTHIIFTASAASTSTAVAVNSSTSTAAAATITVPSKVTGADAGAHANNETNKTAKTDDNTTQVADWRTQRGKLTEIQPGLLLSDFFGARFDLVCSYTTPLLLLLMSLSLSLLLLLPYDLYVCMRHLVLRVCSCACASSPSPSLSLAHFLSSLHPLLSLALCSA